MRHAAMRPMRHAHPMRTMRIFACCINSLRLIDPHPARKAKVFEYLPDVHFEARRELSVNGN
jgi:hypothetical protein